MLNLSNPADREKLEELLADDVDLFCQSYYEQGHRNHLGASTLGEACWRKLWYDFRWVKEERFDGRMMRLFNVGHSAEPRFVTYLRGIGFEVREHQKQLWYSHPRDEYLLLEWDADKSGGMGSFEPVDDAYNIKRAKELYGIKLEQFRMSGAMGHYGGSLDGICKPPARYEIIGDVLLSLSFKTNNTGAGYEKISKEALSKAKPLHWAQECQYGYKYGIRYCIYMIENKNDSDITFKVIELDWNYGAQLEKKASDIIFSKEPPPRISENPALFDCKFCNHAGICHKGETPEKNCRSCRNAVPVDNAEWYCSAHTSNIPPDFIRKGCDQWLPI